MDQNLQGSSNYLRHPHCSNIVHTDQHLYDQRNQQVFHCQNFQENPKFVHVNPAFYAPLSNLSRPPTHLNEMTIPVAKKVILNPKFFPNLQRERDLTPTHTINTVPSVSGNQLISNNSVKHVRADPVVTVQHSYSRYSWKKIEDVQPLQVKSGRSPKVLKSTFRLMKLPLKSPVRTSTPIRLSSSSFFSRYRVDNRDDASKKLKSIKSPKQGRAKYSLIRKGFKTNLTKNLGVRLPLVAFSKSPNRLLRPAVVSHGRIYSNFSSFKVPAASNRRSLLCWTSSSCRSNSKLRTPLKTRNGVKKRNSVSSKVVVKSGKRRQRYYEEKQNEESCELQDHEPIHGIVPEVEVSESGRIPRAPLGELPSFITL